MFSLLFLWIIQVIINRGVTFCCRSLLLESTTNDTDNCSTVSQAADMAHQLTSSSSSVSPAAPRHTDDKTSPSSTDTACSQDDDDDDSQPLELTSHVVTSRLPPATSAVTPASQPPLTLAANTLRWNGHGYDILPPTNLLFPAYYDANALTQTGTLYYIT